MANKGFTGGLILVMALWKPKTKLRLTIYNTELMKVGINCKLDTVFVVQFNGQLQIAW